MTKKRIAAVSVGLLLCAVALVAILSQQNVVVYQGSLDETKGMIHLYLDTASSFAIYKSHASSENSPLYELVDYILHVSEEEALFSKKMSIVAKHDYNIGASGGITIRFELMPIDDKHTRVTVRFKDSWTGMWPPFVCWNPGPIKRYRIANSLNRFIRAQTAAD